MGGLVKERTWRAPTIAIVGILLLVCATSSANASVSQPALDRSFGNGGLVVSPLPDGDGLGASDVEVQHDGQIVTISLNAENQDEYPWSSSSTAVVQRYFADGLPDSSFAGDGVLETDFRAGEEDGRVDRLQVESLGQRLLLASSIYGSEPPYVAVMARGLDGTLLKDFGVGGIVEIDLPGSTYLGDLEVLDSDDTLVAFGTSNPDTGERNSYVTRLLPGGQIDETFGAEGLTRLSAFDRAPELAVGPDGEIFAAARNEDGSWGVTAISSEGSINHLFGENGTASVSFPYNGSSMNDVEVSNSGEVVLAGYVAVEWKTGHDQQLAVARFLPDGQLDPSFGSGGTTEFSIRGYATEKAEDVVVLPDGSLFVAGVSSFDACCWIDSDFIVARLTSTGDLDQSFGINGGALTSFLDGVYASGDSRVHESAARALTLDDQGRAVAAGWAGPWNADASAVARYETGWEAPARQPDVQIHVDQGSPFGEDVYSEFGKGQSWVEQYAVIHKTSGFALRIEDDGVAPGPLRIKGPSGGAHFSIRYLAEGVDVTDQVVGGTYLTAGDGVETELVVSVTPQETAEPENTRWFHVRAFAVEDPTAVDGVALGITPELRLEDLKVRRLAGPWHGDDVVGGARYQTLDLNLEAGRTKVFHIGLDNEGTIGYTTRFEPLEFAEHVDISYRYEGRRIRHQDLSEGDFQVSVGRGETALIEAAVRMEKGAPIGTQSSSVYRIPVYTSSGEILETARVRFNLRK